MATVQHRFSISTTRVTSFGHIFLSMNLAKHIEGGTQYSTMFAEQFLHSFSRCKHLATSVFVSLASLMPFQIILASFWFS